MGETTDRARPDTHKLRVGVSPSSGSGMRDQMGRGAQTQHVSVPVSEDEGTNGIVLSNRYVSPLLLSLKELHRSREMFVKVEVMLGHQILQLDAALGLCEWVETHPGRGKFVYIKGATAKDSPASLSAKAAMLELKAQARKNRLEREREMSGEARKLAVWPWVESIRGAGALGLAQIVAESMGQHTVNGLSDYPGPATLRQRFGLGGDRNGNPQRRYKGAMGVDMGFSPKRRKLMYLIADSLVKSNRGGEYKAFYDAEKARRLERGDDVTKAHAHNHALRLLAKRYLRDLWRAWRAVENGMTDHSTGDTQPTYVRIPLSAEDNAA
jgi:hypothetical protein